jgi:hypothetical protein
MRERRRLSIRRFGNGACEAKRPDAPAGQNIAIDNFARPPKTSILL